MARARNNAGLSANAPDITIKRDATPPVLTLTFTPDSPDGNNGWWKTPGGVPFTWVCSDSTSGVDASYNGGCPSPLTGTVTANGTTNFNLQVHDQAGNSSPLVNRSIMLDNVAPTITLLSRTPANANGWNKSDVSLSWSCYDATSLALSDHDTKTVTTEGLNQSSHRLLSGCRRQRLVEYTERHQHRQDTADGHGGDPSRWFALPA